MAKDSVSQWDTTADNNTDIAGINIAENCPAAGINNAFRAMMAQIATWITTAFNAYVPKAGAAMIGDLTDLGTGSTIKDPGGTARKIGYRNLPLRAATSQQTLALGDVGQLISIATGGIVVPLNSSIAFALGDTVTVYNNSGSSQSVTAAVGVTLRLTGSATTGTRTIAQRGLCTLLKVGTDEWIASGMGVS